MGHLADDIADVLFCVTLSVRFLRRGEPQAENVEKLLGILSEGRGYQSPHGQVITAEKLYSDMALISTFLELVISSIYSQCLSNSCFATVRGE